MRNRFRLLAQAQHAAFCRAIPSEHHHHRISVAAPEALIGLLIESEAGFTHHRRPTTTRISDRRRIHYDNTRALAPALCAADASVISQA